VAIQTSLGVCDWNDGKGGERLCAALRFLEDIGSRRGLRLFPQTNFRALKSVFLANAAAAAVMPPPIDPDIHDMSAADALWVAACDNSGDIVATTFGRQFDWTGTNLKREFESNYLYGGPMRDLTLSWCKKCEMPVAQAEKVTGIVNFCGGIWVRPDYRGADTLGVKLTQVLARIPTVMMHAARRCDIECGFVKDSLVARDIPYDYGCFRMSPGIVQRRPDGTYTPSHLVWRTPEDLDADIRALARGEFIRPVRRLAA
jgi:hypothetical protein